MTKLIKQTNLKVSKYFALISLLIVALMIGRFFLIALPLLLNEVTKVKETGFLLLFVPPLLTFSIAFHAFIKDHSTPKTDLTSWIMLMLILVLWPITLPRILWKKYSQLKGGEVESEKRSVPDSR